MSETDTSARRDYVFLSYASKDREQVLRIAELLRAEGVAIWVDRHAIMGGTAWGTEIAQGIAGCKALALFSSEAALQSRNVKQEVQLAWKYQRPYLPLLLDRTPIPPQMEYFLEGWQWIDVLDQPPEVWMPQVLRALDRLGFERQQPEAATPAAPSPAADALSLSHNLPVPLTSFVGREREVVELKAAVDEARLVTLVGTGGCGKSRLALEVARDLVERYADGVWWVELGSVSDPALVAQELAVALGVREQPGQPLLSSLVDHLRPRQALAVFDNCEHLVTPVAKLAETVLRSCPRVRIMATSREALTVPGEMVFRVHSLPVPDPRNLPPLDELSEYGAVRLFVERARAVEPGFSLVARLATAVVRICHQLDGIPLAIELAAARVKVLAVEQIAQRLSDRFRLLTGGSRTALPQHQTLRAAIDWSYGLLSEQERALFRRLAVFSGGWTLEAAEAICAGDDVEAFEVLDLLTQLVDKSLVVGEEHDGSRRYRLLETIRQYSREKLVEAGEEERTRTQHRDWYLALVEEAEPYLLTADQIAWLDRLEVEHDNLRAALEWSQHDPGGEEAALRLAKALAKFWLRRGYLSEGRSWLEAVLARAPGAPPLLKANALIQAGNFAQVHGDYEAACSFFEQSMQQFDAAGDRPGTASALNNLGNIAFDHGDFGWAKSLYEEGLTLYEQLGDKRGQAGALNNLGEVARRQGDLARASELYERSAALFLELGDTFSLAGTLWNQGEVARLLGDSRRARALYSESLALYRDLGDRENSAWCLQGLAAVAVASGQGERASRLLGAAEALREAIGAQLSPAERPDFEQIVEATRVVLPPPAFERAWQAGRSLPLDRAIEYALTSDELVSAS